MATVLTEREQLQKTGRALRVSSASPFRRLVGVGGIGTGLAFALDGNETLGRGESRSGQILDVRDYCKLHIVSHYVAMLLKADPAGSRFHVLPIGKVGADDPGRRLKAEMEWAGIDVSRVEAVEGRPTLFSVCFQYRDRTGCNITTNDSAAASLSETDVDRCEPVLSIPGERAAAVALPEVTLRVRDRLLKLATRHQALRVASFTRGEVEEARKEGMFSRIDLLALNEEEAAALCGASLQPDAPESFLRSCADALMPYQPEIRVIVTAGRLGAFAIAGGKWDYCPAPAVSAVGTAGAGDALLGGVLAGLAAGMPLLETAGPGAPRSLATALDLGVLVAAYSVTSPHTIHPEAGLPNLLSFAEGLGLYGKSLEPFME